MNETYLNAINLALDDEWDASHNIVQEFSDHYANWIHAVLHKIEGDEWNSRYWYQRTDGKHFEDFAEPAEELLTIQQSLQE